MSAEALAVTQVARTVYLQVPPERLSQGSMTARLAIVYLASFAVTTILVLGVWTSARSQRRPPPPPEVRIVEKVVEVPVPVPVPAEVLEAPVEELPAEELPVEELPAEPSPVPVAPAPGARTSPKPSPRPTPRAPAPVAPAAPVPPAPEVVSAAPAPKPLPPAVPAEVIGLSGGYTGRAKGDPLSISFTFAPDGKLSGRVSRNGGPSLAAAGTYQILGAEKVSFVLLEASGAERIAYSGTLTASGGSGRMAQEGQDVGKFTVVR